MTDLRAALIEAGARRLCEADEGDMGMFGDFYRKQATFVIDAVLDTLADRADELAGDAVLAEMMHRVVAALRGDTE